MPKFRSYLDRDGTDVIRQWFDAHSTTKQARAKFRNRLRVLPRLPRNEWGRPLFDTLGGECRGLSEIRIDAEKIRIDAENVPWRPLGFFQTDEDGNHVFTIVICASKDEHGWKPSNACAIGLIRKEEILANPARAHDLPITLQ
jgi:hypothetical protein